jgi:hypothetical protein
VAVAASGTGNRVMTSPDGINWSIRSSPADNGWISVTWAKELGLLVAVAFSGTGNRVMTSDPYPDEATGTIALQLGPSPMPQPSGSAPLYACRAWVNFNGTGTPSIRASGNVSSVTISGTARYLVSFVNDMPDVNYIAVSMPTRPNTGSFPRNILYRNGETKTTSQISIESVVTGDTGESASFQCWVMFMR